MASNLFNEIENPVTKALYSKAVLDFLSWLTTHEDSSLSALSVTAYRDRLTSLRFSPSTINQRLSAIRRFAAEAVKDGLLSVSSAAEILRVSGKPVLTTSKPRRLTHSAAMEILDIVPGNTVKGLRDKALLAVLIGCGPRRCESTLLRVDSVQFHADDLATLKLMDRHGGHRMIPVPNWVVPHIRSWLDRSGVVAGPLFCALNRHGQLSGSPLSAQAILDIVRDYGEVIGIRVSPHDLRRTCAKHYEKSGREIEQIQLFLGHSNIKVTHRFLNDGSQAANTGSHHSLSVHSVDDPEQPRKPVAAVTKQSRNSPQRVASL